MRHRSCGHGHCTPILVVRPFGVSQNDVAALRQEGESKVSIAQLAAASSQRPADWMAEMIVYWLLDLAKQYTGVTPAVVQQAAEQLVDQYDRARKEIAAVRQAP